MTQSPSHYDRVHALFDEARRVEGAERSALLEERCGGDAELREEVEELLRLLEQDSDALSETGIRAGRGALEGFVDGVTEDAAWTPERVGPYRIVRRVGQGGMGVVYEAEQDSPRRRIALKVLQPFMVTSERLRRFRQEAELLGRLRHPGIAQIYEAGRHDLGHGEHPYFAMEFVDGADLVAHAKRERLPLRARIALLAKVCDAVHHAHENGVIHRDLKPDNVLVDEHGQPKVLDFGVARATEGTAALSTLVTEDGDLLGTITYMSPEQLDGHAERITPRSDVYALGAVAFELLAGRLPHDLVGLPLTAAMQIVRDKEPPRLGDLRPELRGDVETIVEKALAKEPERRYSSVAELADDLRAFLDSRPIAARPPSRAYLVRKFARRNRALVFGLTGTFLAVFVGAVVASVLYLLSEKRGDELQRALYAAQISQANVASENNNPERARELLDACEPDLRGWEWDYLSMLGSGDTAFRGHQNMVVGVAFRSGGSELVSLGRDALRVSDVATGREVRSYSSGVFNGPCAFSASGDRVVWAGAWSEAEGTRQPVRSIDLAEPDSVPSELFGSASSVRALAVDPSGERLVVATETELTGWDLGTDETLFTVSIDYLVGDLSFAPDGREIAMAGAGRVEQRDAENGEVSWTVAVEDTFVRVAFDPRGSRFATANWEGRIGLWSRSGEGLARTSARDERIYGLAFLPDGSRLFSAADSRVTVWDADRLEPLLRLTGHTDKTTSVAVSARGDAIASGSQDNTARVWGFGPEMGASRTEPRCLAHWTFDDAPGDRVADETESFHGFAVGGERVDGPVGTALELDGRSTFVDVPHDMGRHARLSIATWFRVDFSRAQSRWISLVSNRGWTSHVPHLLLQDEDGDGEDVALQFSVYGNAQAENYEDVVSEEVVRSNVWYHAVVTYDSESGRVELMLDGELVHEESFLRANPVDLGHGGGISLGAGFGLSGPPRHLAGGLDDVRIYNYVLTKDEIDALVALGAVDGR